MAKTAAERQKEYRERRKARDSTFLEKERERIKRYYVPASEMNKRELAKRNKKAAIKNRVSRLRHKIQACEERQREMADTNDAVENAVEPELLRVRLPCMKTKKNAGVKKRRKRALAIAGKKMKKMAEDIATLKKKVRAKDKQLRRIKKKNSQQVQTEEVTPRKAAEQDMHDVNVTPGKRRRLKRKLLLGNALLQEIRETGAQESRKVRHPLHNILAGKITKKYRLITAISRGTGLARNSLNITKSKVYRPRKEVRRCLSKEIEDACVSFMKREDNSRMMPGKADAKRTEEGKKEQSVVLTDYLHNLHLKFLAEHPDLKVSLSTFCRLRPKNVLLANFISRNACLCLKHQNMALKINAARKEGITSLNRNPDLLLEKMETLEEALDDLPPSLEYKTWKRVAVKEGDKEVHKMRVVDIQATKEEFITVMLKEANEFCDHVKRVKAQYQELRSLKQNLPEHECIIQMDFAENFSCRSMDEVQTAYWHQTSVTLHPSVIYYTANGTLKHKSVVIVSDDMHHSPGTVLAFLDNLMPKVREIDPEMKKVHYWTDSPSSQYRNRFIFDTLARHEDLYGMMSTWNFFEAGHGKGPCDGLGGTTKRLADEAIKQGKAVIQDAKDFYRWCIVSSLTPKVDFLYVEADTCEEKREELKKMTIKTVKNTMKIHAVIGISATELYTKETSCYCDACLKGEYCDAWSKVQMKSAKTKQQASVSIQAPAPVPEEEAIQETDQEPPQETAEETVQESENYKIGDFVACTYGTQWYIGEIVDFDEHEDEYQVNFMEKALKAYRWPRRKDEIWVANSDVICAVAEPVATGKTQRCFAFSENDLKKIQAKFNK